MKGEIAAAALLLAAMLALTGALLMPGRALAKEQASDSGLAAGQIADGASSGAAASSETTATSGSETSSAASTPVSATPAKKKLTVEQKLAKVNLKVRAKLQYDGWQKAVASGKMAGTKTKQGLRKLKVKLAKLGGATGSIRYKTYVPGAGWSKLAKDGVASGSSKRAITAVRVYLKGQVSKYYDVYYRAYFKGYGWLDWAKNNKVAGTKSTFGYVSAVQVKLVKKTRAFKGATKTPYVKNRWQAIERKYRDKEDVGQLLEVKYAGGSKARVVLRTKAKTKKGVCKWKTALSCKGYVGSQGIGAAREWLARTPEGDFGITDAFGIKSDPGALLNYVKVTRSMYWCADRSHYNELIDINRYPHDCSGEHLIDYSPHYDYGLFFDYNTNPVRYGRGSAFFVHCTGGTPYTGGCIAVSKPNMVKIIRTVDYGSRLCIYHK